MNALNDIIAAIRQPNIWFILGVQDYLRQFERTALGAFWAFAQPLVFVAAIGFFFAPFMSDNQGEYVIHVAIGFAIYTFVSGALSECGNAFITHRGIIQNFSTPMFVHILREEMRNICRLAAQLLVAGLVMVVYSYGLGPVAFLAILGIAINLIAALAASLVVSMITVRWGDTQFAIGAIMRLMFFATPIIWVADADGGVRTLAAKLNPITHFIEIVRAPLLGEAPTGLSWIVTVGITLVGIGVTLFVFNMKRNNIAIWAQT